MIESMENRTGHPCAHRQITKKADIFEDSSSYTYCRTVRILKFWEDVCPVRNEFLLYIHLQASKVELLRGSSLEGEDHSPKPRNLRK